MTDADIMLRSAVHALIGYTESLKAGAVVTQGYCDRLRQHYIANVLKALAEKESLLPNGNISGKK